VTDGLIPLAEARQAKAEESGLPDIRHADVSRWEGIEPPPLNFTIADLLPEGMTSMLVAEGGAGKSILMQTALTCIATGRRFVGKECLPGTAAGIFAEDPENILHARQARICEVFGVDAADLAGRVYVASYAGLPAALWRDGRPTPWMTELEEQLAGLDELRLVTLDNAALLYADNENDRIAVTGFLNRLNGMAQRLGAAVLLSTHASKSQDGSALRVASGSTAWVNAARGVIGLEPERDGEPAILKVVKANHSQPGEEVRLEWRQGLLMAREDATGIVGSIKRSTCQRVFMELLRRVTSEGRHVSDAKPVPTSSGLPRPDEHPLPPPKPEVTNTRGRRR